MRLTKICRSFIASILIVCMLFTMMPQQALAAVTETIGLKTQEKEAILQELRAITGSEEEAQALYYRMNALGLFDDKGNWVTEELMIDGNIFTLQEAKMAVEQMDDNKLVTVGDVTISVRDLKIMIEIEEEITRIKETYFRGEEWTTQEVNSIESLQQSLNNGDFLVQQSQVVSDSEVGPSGANHWLRVSIDVSKAIINETEGIINVPVTLSRYVKQRVSFKWR